MRVAVDIGNTSLHLKTADGAKKRFSATDPAGVRNAAMWLADQPEPVFAIMASVCRSAEKQLQTNLRERFADAGENDDARRSPVQTIVLSHVDVPIEHDVDHIDRVGIDRLVAAFAASRIAGGDCIVIDSGSAITADVVAGGQFRGGVIMPGLRMQTRALAGGTDRLYEIDFESPDIALPGRNTTDAMAGGILTSVVAGLDRIIDAYRKRFGSELPVIGTGGDVMFLHHRLASSVHIDADLVCDGILALDVGAT